MLDKVLFYGKGAGKLPTASAVVADIMDIAEKMSNEQAPSISWTEATENDIANNDLFTTKWCIILDGKANEGTYFASINKTAIISDEINKSSCESISQSFKCNYKIYPIV